MAAQRKRILIIDEHGFSRICSALLDNAGYGAEIARAVEDLRAGLNTNEYGLVVTSYPYGASLLPEIKKSNLPTIILSDNIDGKLIDILDDFADSYCMIKPLDYEKFKSLVQQVMSGEHEIQEGYNLV
ncbi:MAG TPA: hypothetical protein VEI96_02465 [Thermodesulfovibrionales bacterium]|nr:hypothetical protein [Thermodesulfovibrionales bacterium]